MVSTTTTDVDITKACTHILVNSHMQNILSPPSVLDNSLLSRPHSAQDTSTSRREDRVRNDGLEVVGGRGPGVGSGNGSLLESKEVVVGLTEVLGNLSFEGGLDVVLRIERPLLGPN